MKSWTPHVQSFARLIDHNENEIDQAMTVFHPGPHSYTGEDLAELSCHGNPLLVDTILETICATHLARPAQQGEFTRRAFMSGKLDLAQAEAVGALISAGSSAGIEMARSLLDGDLSKNILHMGRSVRDLLAQIEASFINDDAEISNETILEGIAPVIQQIDALLADHTDAPSLFGGISTTIAGLPNAGKSSLFNAILGYPRAIVHSESGTTRDIIREHITIGGIDFLFHDTAGIRDTSSGPEQIGVKKTIERLAESDLVLYVVDSRTGLTEGERQWLDIGKKTIVVMNKIDLKGKTPHDVSDQDTVWVSAKYGDGIDRLTQAMTGIFPRNLPRVLMERHACLLEKARASLRQAEESVRAGMTPDVIVMDISQADTALRTITGQDITDDILDRIFSRFCVGK